jgi:hypothetical protein
MVQHRGRKGVSVGRKAGQTAIHFRPLTMFEGIVASATVPFNVFGQSKSSELQTRFVAETEPYGA